MEETQITVRFSTKLPANLRVPETPMVRAIKLYHVLNASHAFAQSLAAMHAYSRDLFYADGAG